MDKVEIEERIKNTEMYGIRNFLSVNWQTSSIQVVLVTIDSIIFLWIRNLKEPQNKVYYKINEKFKQNLSVFQIKFLLSII